MGERSIFVEAVEIADPAERERFLVRACRGDAALRAAVEDLLRWHDAAPAFLDRPAVAPSADDPAGGWPVPDGTVPDPLLGAEVDGVTLLRLLGEGGFARVYEGEQRHPRRRVAVKVLDPGIAGPAAIARFLRESDILASLDHPGIARVFAAGTIRCLGRALPCFVMELVGGATPIDESAACRDAPLREKLRLLREVCDAVAHAHRQGVVHRDLKPANVLVDDAGRPRIIDFGWARLVTDGTPATEARTRLGQIVGTAQYMSPEQFAGDSSAVDARADVWALGVILHGMLVGRPPFDLAGKNVYEAAAIVREATVPPIGRGIPRDLAVIVATCLEKTRERRYADAGALADDLGRHLAGQPILASPPGLLDGLWLLARRHRPAAAGFAAAVAALVAGSAGIALFATRAEIQRGHAERARRAEAEARSAADSARERADADSRSARRSLYVATTRRLSALSPTADPRESEALLATAARLAGELGVVAPGEGPPLEVALVAPRFDRSIAALVCPAPVLALAAMPGGGTVAIGGGDGTLRVRGPDAGKGWADLTGHAAPVSASAVDPTGTRLASAAADGTVLVRDPATGAVRARLAVPARIDEVAFDDSGTRLATASRDRIVRVFDADTGDTRASLDGHRARVDAVRFRPGSGGRELATASPDGTTILWDADSGTPRATFAGRRTRRAAVAFSPAGDRLAVASKGDGVDLIDTASLEVVARLPGPAKGVTAIEFARDGGRLAFVTDDGVVHLWDPRGTAPIARLGGHRRRVSAVRFSPDGTRLATSSWDRTVRVWDASDGASLDVLAGHRVAVDGVEWDGEGAVLVSAGQDGTVRWWDPGGGLAVVRGFSHDVRSVRYTPDGTRVVATSSDGATRVCDVASATGRLVARAREGRGAESVLSGDGRLLASDARDGRVTIHAVGDAAAPRLELPRADGRVVGLDFTPEAARLLVASAGGTLRLTDVGEGATVAEARGVVPEVQASRLLPGSGVVVAGGRGGEVALWDPDSGAIRRAEACGGRVRSITARPGRDEFVTAAEEGAVLLRDGVTGAVRGTLLRTTARPTAVRFSPDGARLAVGDESGRIWICTVEGGGRVELVGHEQRIHALAWSPDGRRLATASEDRTIRLWDPEDGAELVALDGHAGAVLDVAIAPHGRGMASASADGTVRLWGLSEREISDARAARARPGAPPAP